MKSFIVYLRSGPDDSICGVYTSRDIAEQEIACALERAANEPADPEDEDPDFTASLIPWTRQNFFIQEMELDKGFWQ